MAFGANRWVAISGRFDATNVAAWSTDGITWSSTTLPASVRWTEVTFGANLFVVVGYGGNVAYSTNGATWTLGATPEARTLGTVLYGGDRFVTLGYFNNPNYGAHSTNGITWSSFTFPGANDSNVSSLAYGAGRFVASIPYTRSVIHSTNGITWSENTLAFPNNTTQWDVAFTGNRFLGMAQNQNTTLISTDGITWTNSGANILPNNSALRKPSYGDFTVACLLYTSDAADE